MADLVMKSREQMLRDWQQSRDRKLSVAMDDMELDGANKENAPENRTPRKNFRDSTASSDAKRKPAAKGKNALDDEPRRESLAGEGGAKSNALDNFKTKFEEFGRRQSARATATGPSRIPLPPTGAIAEEEDFEASQGKLCISKEQIFDLTASTFDEEAFMMDCEKAFNYKLTSTRYDFKNREAEQENLVRLLRRCLRTAFSKKDSLVREVASMADLAQQQLEGARLAVASAEAARDAAKVDHSVTSAALQRAREEAKRAQEHFNSTLAALHKELDDKTEEAAAAADEADAALAALREELTRYQELLDDKSHEHDTLAAAHERSQAEGRRLAEALDDAETRDREHCADHEVARAALQEAIAALEGDVAAEQHAHAAAVAAAGEHLASVEAQHLDEKTALEATLADVRSSLAALQTAHAELSARLDATVAMLQKEEAAHHAEAERALALEEDVASLQALQADLESKVATLETSESTLAASLAETTEAKVAAEAEVASLTSTNAEQVAAASAAAAEAAQTQADLKLEVEGLEGERAHLTANVVGLEEQLMALKGAHEELGKAKLEVEGVLTNTETTLGETQREVTGLKASEAALHADLSAAHAATAEARAEGDSHKEAGDVARAQVVALTEEKAAAEAAAEAAAGKLATAEAVATAQAEKAMEATTQLMVAMAQLESEKEEVAALQTKLSAMKAEAAAAAAAVEAEKEEAAKRSALLEGDLQAFLATADADGASGGADGAVVKRLVATMAELEACRRQLGELDAARAALATEKAAHAASQKELRAAEETRRQLHNTIQELRGNVRVFCRVRPMPSRAGEAAAATFCMPDATSVRLDDAKSGASHTFTYDRVFDAQSAQADVFAEVSQLVQSALDGYKVCLFSYGQTGAGKTHTMLGCGSGEQRGIIPRAVEKVLEQADVLREKGWSFAMEASYLEIYNEKLRDLLAAGATHNDHAIQHKDGQTLVTGVHREEVASVEAAAGLVRRAAAARAVEATAMNEQSSRSHTVFMLYITATHAAAGTVLRGALNLVDLAGSERLSRSEATGDRARETCNINKSLSCLGDVFNALARKQSHVPYRNSKLTYLLQPCLGGDGKTLMFVNINPEPASAGETLCSLRFAGQVNACELGGKGAGSGAKRNVSTVAEPNKEEGAGAAAPKAAAGRTRPATAPAKRKLPGDAEPQKRGSRAKI